MEKNKNIFLDLYSDAETKHIKDTEKRQRYKDIIYAYKIAITCAGYFHRQETTASLELICALSETEDATSYSELMAVMQKETHELLTLLESDPSGIDLFDSLQSYFTLVNAPEKQTCLPVHYGMYKRQVDTLLYKIFSKEITLEDANKRVTKIVSSLASDIQDRTIH